MGSTKEVGGGWQTGTAAESRGYDLFRAGTSMLMLPAAGLLAGAGPDICEEPQVSGVDRLALREFTPRFSFASTGERRTTSC